jgi:hypothetical protein
MHEKPRNGHAHSVEEIEDAIKGIEFATAMPLPRVTITEPVKGKHFEQQAHDLLLESIDKVAHEWVDELQHIRSNSEQVEHMVLERIAKIKNDITQLYLLGNAAMVEAQRGDEINTKLSGELDKLRE